MNHHTVKRLGLNLALRTEVEGMIAANMESVEGSVPSPYADHKSRIIV
jgi:hypothetical protein